MPIANGQDPSVVRWKSLDGLPGKVEIPLALVAAMNALRVEGREHPADVGVRKWSANRRNHQRCQAGAAANVELEERAVEQKGANLVGILSIRGVERGDKPAGGVAHQQQLRIAILAYPLDGLVDLLEVFANVPTVVRVLMRQQRAPVLAEL